VFIDARQLLETIRFDWGTVADPRGGAPVDISRLTGERVTFNIYIVDPVSSRKLGSAMAVRPNRSADAPESSIPLLPVDASGPVRPLVWKVMFTEADEENHSDAPVLAIDNAAANGSAVTFLDDPKTRALILPAAMREVLVRVLLVDKTSYDESSRAWRHCWLRFAARLLDEAPPSVDGPTSLSDGAEWVERSTAALAAKAELFDRFLRERAS
jgi:hypothetical protein